MSVTRGSRRISSLFLSQESEEVEVGDLDDEGPSQKVLGPFTGGLGDTAIVECSLGRSHVLFQRIA